MLTLQLHRWLQWNHRLAPTCTGADLRMHTAWLLSTTITTLQQQMSSRAKPAATAGAVMAKDMTVVLMAATFGKACLMEEVTKRKSLAVVVQMVCPWTGL
jgi:hypothetical protein